MFHHSPSGEHLSLTGWTGWIGFILSFILLGVNLLLSHIPDYDTLKYVSICFSIVAGVSSIVATLPKAYQVTREYFRRKKRPGWLNKPPNRR